MKILCSGNPTHTTVASAVKILFPTTHFACRSTGFDLTLATVVAHDHFISQICKFNVFINSSNIDIGVQLRLLKLTHAKWMQENVLGHIINIGSSIELTDNMSQYAQSKRELKSASLDFSKQVGISGVKCTHIIASGINDGNPGHEHWLKLNDIAKCVEFILLANHNIPLIHLEP